MDKYELVLDIIEHPGNYSAEQLREILSDAETVEIYNLLSKTESAVAANKAAEVDVDAEWKEFTQRHPQHRRRSRWSGSRAASIAVLSATSLVAVAIGIAVTVSVKDTGADVRKGDSREVVAEVPYAEAADVDAQPSDAVTAAEPVMFEDATLQEVMDTVVKTYHVRVIYKNKEVAALRLYYKFDPNLTLDEIIGQLNNFEQINIVRSGVELNID